LEAAALLILPLKQQGLLALLALLLERQALVGAHIVGVLVLPVVVRVARLLVVVRLRVRVVVWVVAELELKLVQMFVLLLLLLLKLVVLWVRVVRRCRQSAPPAAKPAVPVEGSAVARGSRHAAAAPANRRRHGLPRHQRARHEAALGGLREVPLVDGVVCRCRKPRAYRDVKKARQKQDPACTHMSADGQVLCYIGKGRTSRQTTQLER